VNEGSRLECGYMGWVGGKLDGIGLVWIMSERKFYKISFFFFMFSPVFLFPIADFSSHMVVLG